VGSCRARARLRVLQDGAVTDLRSAGLSLTRALFPAVRELGLLRRPPATSIEARPTGRIHSRQRDAAAVSHHYDVGNDFYRLVLGPSMTYSCARSVNDRCGLDEAQWAKHDLICRKLGLNQRTGMRLLDFDCGWGTLCHHAAEHYGAQVVGVTLSREQAEWAKQRIDKSGCSDRVEIRLADYRSLRGEMFDAISSVGMFEHVGSTQAALYFETLFTLISPGGRLLNHAISKSGGSRIARRSFIGRYVFPDGELIDVGQVVLACSVPDSRCETWSRSVSITPRPSMPGCPTSWAIGSRPWPWWGRIGHGCGACTWPLRPMDSTMAGSAFIRSSVSSRLLVAQG
jgi:cyclopropane-fatty-acyl-phospholipid synthase